MKYIGRLTLYAIIFWLTLSVGYVLAMRFVPVTITPLKIEKLFENRPETPFRVRSEWTALGNINPSLTRAVIATEDNFFLAHRGFDWKSIQKAIDHNKRGGKVRGASTISQQTAKNVFCRPARTWIRKGFETYYTVLIEALWSKRRIMEVYLNVIEVGPNVYGAGSAARLHFKKDAAELNVYDSSLIATVLPNPIRMKLAAPSSYMLRRATQVRALMRASLEPDFDDRTKITEQYEKYKRK
ncbi:MAG: monofunctional biosynthetic peptidoglycan transglycosylase [Rikenellaceae bacterium]|jgi:monofunctional biosynthetic peptidoglycan transglycosylase|nr:monofunctional biosynthetic peptidoglycan transglycosylase [Rikenellaceae bacterium]